MRPLPNGTTEYLSVTVAPDTTAAEMAEFFADDAEVRRSVFWGCVCGLHAGRMEACAVLHGLLHASLARAVVIARVSQTR